MVPPAKTPRTLSTAGDRREAVILAGMPLFAEKGIHATPTLEIAKAAGISQAYLFRLFPTKIDLAVAVAQRCNERIESTFRAAAAAANAVGEDPLDAMGEAYAELIQDRTLLLLQLHAHAAAPQEPAIRDAMRSGFRNLHALIRAETDADEERIAGFFAKGMLMNVLAALGAFDLDEPWAQTMGHKPGAAC